MSDLTSAVSFSPRLSPLSPSSLRATPHTACCHPSVLESGRAYVYAELGSSQQDQHYRHISSTSCANFPRHKTYHTILRPRNLALSTLRRLGEARTIASLRLGVRARERSRVAAGPARLSRSSVRHVYKAIHVKEGEKGPDRKEYLHHHQAETAPDFHHKSAAKGRTGDRTPRSEG